MHCDVVRLLLAQWLPGNHSAAGLLQSAGRTPGAHSAKGRAGWADHCSSPDHTAVWTVDEEPGVDEESSTPQPPGDQHSSSSFSEDCTGLQGLVWPLHPRKCLKDPKRPEALPTQDHAAFTLRKGIDFSSLSTGKTPAALGLTARDRPGTAGSPEG